MLEERPGVRQAGQRVGERVPLRLLEDDRVVDDRGRLAADPVEQPGMVFLIEPGFRVVHRKRSNQLAGKNQRTDERRLENRRRVRSHRFDIGLRPRIDERPAVSCDPSHQPLAVLDHQLLNQLRVDSGRKTAVQLFRALGIQKERTGGKRDEIRQLGRHQRHRVGDGQTRGDRLRDVVERVDFPVGGCNAVERQRQLAHLPCLPAFRTQQRETRLVSQVQRGRSEEADPEGGE